MAAGCGYVGEPLPPLANIPAAVANLAAIQRGGEIIVHFPPPQMTTEGRAVRRPLEFDLRIGTPVTPFSTEAWAAQAHQLPAPAVRDGLAEEAIPAAPWAGRDVTIAVRSIGTNHKVSSWSNFVNLSIVPPPARPTDLQAAATADGVRLTWHGDGGDFVVLRRSGEESEFTRVGEAQQAEFLDRTAEFGKSYRYLVQRVVKLGNGRVAESELSNEAAVTPRDTFPPGAPAGLRGVSAPGSIELTWDQNPEPDVAGYRIYRGATTEPLARLAETGLVPAYSDHAVEPGKTYRYAVSAVDRAGNEGPRSGVAEVAAQ